MKTNIILLTTTLVALLSPFGSAQVPQIINYQGKINVGATPFTGTGQFKFALVNGDGSASYWSNDGTSAVGSEPAASVLLPLANGLYVVPLGDTTIPGMQAVPATVFTNSDVRLRVWFNDGTNGSQQLSPDQRITSVGYAMVAGTVPDGAITADKLAPGITVNGSITGNASTATNATNLASQLSGAGSINQGGNPVDWSQLKGVPAGFADGSDDGISSDPTKLPLAGGTMAGILNMGNNRISNLSFPSAGMDAANKSYVDQFVSILNSQMNEKVSRGGDTISGNLVVNGTVTATSFNGLTRMTPSSGPTVAAQPNQGYLLTNAAQVTVTLPSSPAVGDVVRVASSGAGGWKIAQNAGQSIVGTGSMLGGSSLGSTWGMTYNNTASWYATACSSSGSRVYAVANNSGVYASSDYGATWTYRGGPGNALGIACSANGTKLVTGFNGGQILTSTDFGVTWTTRSPSGNWRAFASSADGAKLVAVPTGGQIHTSTDSGVTWTARDSARNWYGVASSSDGTKLVAVVQPGQIYTSTDSGVNWTARESSRLWSGVASSSDGAKLVAVAQGQIYTSTDSGVNWTARESSRSWFSVSSSADGTILTAGVASGGVGQLYTSMDSGVTWTARDSARHWAGVAMSADGSRQFASANGVGLFVSNPTPTTGSTTGTAGYLAGPQYSSVDLLYIGSNQFMLRSHEGNIFAY